MKMRTTKPSNKFYNTAAKGGLSKCIIGKPTDKGANVLANCVGYACGRFNEIIGEMKYPTLYTNAENFIEQAKKLGLKISKEPTLGGILVWQKGATLKGSDGAGHVAIVERIDNKNQVYTSESAWGGRAFYNATRKNNNGKWGAGTGYTYRGCIVNPSVKEVEKTLKYKIGDEVKISGTLYGTADGTKAGKSVRGRTTKITRAIEGKSHPYNTTGDLGWIAESQITLIEKTNEFKVGDYVVPIKLIDYRGRKIRQYDKKYEIMQIDKRGAVLGAVRRETRLIWAVVKLDNLRRI